MRPAQEIVARPRTTAARTCDIRKTWAEKRKGRCQPPDGTDPYGATLAGATPGAANRPVICCAPTLRTD